MKPHIVTEGKRAGAGGGGELEGKLYLPRDGVVSRLVVQVNGSGPQTCNTFRDRGDGTTYSFCGFFGEELAGRGLGFFCYSTRGCTDGDQGPLYCRVDRAVYRSYTPQTCVADLEDWTALLQAHPRCAGAELLLLGWSEGTMIAPAVAAGGSGTPGRTAAGGLRQRDHGGRPWTGSSGGWGCTPCSASILTPTEMGASPGRSLRRGRERCGRPWRRPSPGWTWTGTAGSPRRTWRRCMPGAGRRSSGPSRRGDDEWLWEHYPVPSPPTGSGATGGFPQPGDPAPSGPAHPYPPGEVGRQHPCGGRPGHPGDLPEAGKDNLAVHIYPDAGHALGFEQYLATGELPPRPHRSL